jgi:general secretion pathway protein D
MIVAALLLAPVASRAQEPARAPEQGVQFDFQDVELRLVLAALAEAGRLNLIHGDLPSRRVTLRTNQPVARENILPLLRSLAASNNLKVIEEGGFVRIEDVGPRELGGGAPAAADTTAAELRLFVYRLKHARAARLASTLQAIFGGAGAGGNAAAAALSRRPLSERLREQQVPPTVPEGRPEVAVQMGPTRAPSLPAQLVGEVQIVPDEATNSLLIRAQPDDWSVVRQSIEALDLRPLQVLIEVMIAEVRKTRDFQLGVSGIIGRDSATVENKESASLATNGDFALRVMRVGSVNLNVALAALASRGDVRVLSRPVLLAQNNQEARILIGSERPFVQVFRSLPTDAAVRDQVVQYRDVGTSLTLLPTINDDGYVNLQLAQEVSTATAETQFGAPVIATREASTHLFVRDGQTAVIGGLVDRSREHTRSGVPLLKDLPLLGMLFGSTRENETNSELFLFLTPHIIATDEDVERVRQGLDRSTELLKPELPVRPLIVPPPAAKPDTTPTPTPTP